MRPSSAAVLDTPTQITSHLLAALNLPPLENVSPFPLRDRPLPLEPATSAQQRDAFSSARRSVQQQQQQLQNDQMNYHHLLHYHHHHQMSTGDVQSLPVSVVYPPIITPLRAGDLSLQNIYSPVQTQPQTAAMQHLPHESELPLEPSPPVTTGPELQLQLVEQQPQYEYEQQHGQEYEQQLSQQAPQPAESKTKRKKATKKRRIRRKWTEQETNALIRGCREHGVGNWKKVLDDPKYKFNDRSAVDLKDRFRTCFPKEYRKDITTAEPVIKVEPNQDGTEATAGFDQTPKPQSERGRRRVTKTEMHHANILKVLGISGNFPKVARRERHEFTAEEDDHLLQGFELYGPSWSKIQGDPGLNLGHRRSTDLRDRFRNAFPKRYESAGFKARARQIKAESITGDGLYDEEDAVGELDPDKQVDLPVQDRPQPTKADSTAFIVNNLMNEHLAANWIEPPSLGISAPAHQSPVAAMLPLDPALSASFEASTLEQLTSDLLRAAEQSKNVQATTTTNGSVGLSWDDIPGPSIFADVESAFSMDTKPVVGLDGDCIDVKPIVIASVKPSMKIHAASAPRKRRPSGPL